MNKDLIINEINLEQDESKNLLGKKRNNEENTDDNKNISNFQYFSRKYFFSLRI